MIPLDGFKVRLGRPTIVITRADGTVDRVVTVPPQLQALTPTERSRVKRFLGLFLSLLVLGVVGLAEHQLALGGVSLAMASIVPIAFKRALLAGRAWKVAAYVAAANLGNATAGYSASNEVVGPGYAAGGIVLVETITNGSDGLTVLLDFVDVSWGPGATFTGRYLLIYDNNAAGKEGFVIDMGADQAVSGGTLTIQWPVPDLLTAIFQLA